MQQRLRAAAGTLYKDLVMAGAGPSRGANTGSLGYYFAPVLPFRQGTSHDDPPGSFRTDTITLMYVPPTFAQTTLATAGPGAAVGGYRRRTGRRLSRWRRAVRVQGRHVRSDLRRRQRRLRHVHDHGCPTRTCCMSSAPAAALHARITSRMRPRLFRLTSIVYSLKSDAVAGTYQLCRERRRRRRGAGRRSSRGADVRLLRRVATAALI